MSQTNVLALLFSAGVMLVSIAVIITLWIVGRLERRVVELERRTRLTPRSYIVGERGPEGFVPHRRGAE